jgi:hypothetical protein
MWNAARIHENGVHHTEDRDIGANPQRERQDRRDAECGVLSQQPRGISSGIE